MLHSSFFRKFDLFAELDERELSAIAAVAKVRRYAKDDAIFHADESGDVFCLIKEGQVKITMISPEGKEIILSMLGPGEFFGEMSLLDDAPRSATVIATEPLNNHDGDGANVLFADGQVEWLTAEKYKLMMEIPATRPGK